MEVGEGLLPPFPLPAAEPVPEPKDEPLPDPELEALPLFDPEFEPDPAEDPGIPEPLVPTPGCDAEGVGELEDVVFAAIGLELPPHPVRTSPVLTRTAVNKHDGKGIRAAALYIFGTSGIQVLCPTQMASRRSGVATPPSY